METSSSFAICLSVTFLFIIVVLLILLFAIKIGFVFINGNLTQKYVDKRESFQHYYVFVAQLGIAFVERVNIYINLTFEVRVKFIKNKLI
jgi:hypothetical protein